MDEILEEFMPDWCNDDFDLQLAQNVDEYEKKSRFVSVNDNDVDQILTDSHSKSTKRHTKWVIKLFEGKKFIFEQYFNVCVILVGDKLL